MQPWISKEPKNHIPAPMISSSESASSTWLWRPPRTHHRSQSPNPARQSQLNLPSQQEFHNPQTYCAPPCKISQRIELVWDRHSGFRGRLITRSGATVIVVVEGRGFVRAGRIGRRRGLAVGHSVRRRRRLLLWRRWVSCEILSKMLWWRILLRGSCLSETNWRWQFRVLSFSVSWRIATQDPPPEQIDSAMCFLGQISGSWEVFPVEFNKRSSKS